MVTKFDWKIENVNKIAIGEYKIRYMRTYGRPVARYVVAYLLGSLWQWQTDWFVFMCVSVAITNTTTRNDALQMDTRASKPMSGWDPFVAVNHTRPNNVISLVTVLVLAN